MAWSLSFYPQVRPSANSQLICTLLVGLFELEDQICCWHVLWLPDLQLPRILLLLLLQLFSSLCFFRPAGVHWCLSWGHSRMFPPSPSTSLGSHERFLLLRSRLPPHLHHHHPNHHLRSQGSDRTPFAFLLSTRWATSASSSPAAWSPLLLDIYLFPIFSNNKDSFITVPHLHARLPRELFSIDLLHRSLQLQADHFRHQILPSSLFEL